MSDRTPSVEDRLYEVERALALGTLVSRALSHVDDLCMDRTEENAAFSRLSDILEEGTAAHRALKSALTNEAMRSDAPNAESE